MNLVSDRPRLAKVELESGGYQGSRRLTGEEQPRLVSDYQAGQSVYDLAETFGIHRTTVAVLLRRNGVELRYRKLSPSASLWKPNDSTLKVGRSFVLVSVTASASPRCSVR